MATVPVFQCGRINPGRSCHTLHCLGCLIHDIRSDIKTDKDRYLFIVTKHLHGRCSRLWVLGRKNFCYQVSFIIICGFQKQQPSLLTTGNLYGCLSQIPLYHHVEKYLPYMLLHLLLLNLCLMTTVRGLCVFGKCRKLPPILRVHPVLDTPEDIPWSCHPILALKD